MTDLDRYSIIIRFCEESGEYIAFVPELPGCAAVGKTRAHALAGVPFENWMDEAKRKLPSGKVPAPILTTMTSIPEWEAIIKDRIDRLRESIAKKGGN